MRIYYDGVGKNGLGSFRFGLFLGRRSRDGLEVCRGNGG